MKKLALDAFILGGVVALLDVVKFVELGLGLDMLAAVPIPIQMRITYYMVRFEIKNR